MHKDMGKEYKCSAVAFLDILGFKSMVEESKDDKKKFDQILNALRVMKFRKRGNNKEERQEGNFVSIFSDSIVISYHESSLRQALFDLIEDVMNLQNELLEYRVLCRGGIAVGKLYHSKTKVFGPALIQAYCLEKDMAKYPRVVLEKSILEQCNKADCKELHSDLPTNQIMQYLCRDEQNPSLLYVDYLHRFIPKYLHDYNQHINECIEDGLKMIDPSISNKYEWLKKYWSRSDGKKESAPNSHKK